MSQKEKPACNKELGEMNDQLLDIAFRLKEAYSEEAEFALMKIEAASRDIHNLRIKQLLNTEKDGIQ